VAIFVDLVGEIFALGDGESLTGKESRLAGKRANAVSRDRKAVNVAGCIDLLDVSCAAARRR
jgi:hypothetical protein